MIKCYSEFSLYGDYNILYNFKGYLANENGIYIGGVNDLTGDPGYLNDSLEIPSTSPAKNNGASPAEYDFVPGNDIIGTERPQGSGYDIGAYEYEE